jgi:A/G-specific adenine glycosylase
MKSVTKNLLSESFVRKLVHWNKSENTRLMPWKGEKDPYKIWLSEIILQQTRVQQGLKYYESFIKAFPTIHHLASAPEQVVYKLWEGLGYYNRCNNLIKTAKFISYDLKGIFPSDYQSLIELKGIGPYTAAAISSFAFNLPYAVLDGNVFRVLSRIFRIEIPMDSPEGKNFFSNLAQSILPPKKSAAYNQAIMDFGATICKPHPECALCFFKNDCLAFQYKQQLLLPVRQHRIIIKERWFHYIILQYGDTVALQQRTMSDIWQNLYEVVLFEGFKRWKDQEVLLQLAKTYGIKEKDYDKLSVQDNKTQRLTHQLIHFSFINLSLHKKLKVPGYTYVHKTELDKYPFPKTLQAYLSTL